MLKENTEDLTKELNNEELDDVLSCVMSEMSLKNKVERKEIFSECFKAVTG